MRYRRKPTVIKAIQFCPDVQPWPAGVAEHTQTMCDDPQCGDSTWDHYCTLGHPTGRYYVWNALHRSRIDLKPGDWVRQDDPNDYYPIDQAIFEQTYEPVEEITAAQGREHS